MTDMYAAGFYPFPTEEAKWGYWSKAALLNRFDLPALPLYKELYDIVKERIFVLTTNVDHQFYKAGFDENRIFATQGDYGKYSVRKPVIQRPTMHKKCLERWMKQGKNA